MHLTSIPRREKITRSLWIGAPSISQSASREYLIGTRDFPDIFDKMHNTVEQLEPDIESCSAATGAVYLELACRHS